MKGPLMKTTNHLSILGILASACLALTGCVSLGTASEPPASLLTLTATSAAPAGTLSAAGGENSVGVIGVLVPETPAKLDVVRVPVTVSDTEIAYLQNAVWVEKPARLFRRLVGETLRERIGDKGLVLDSEDTPVRPTVFVRGTLLDLGYDVPSSSVIVRYEAIISTEDGAVFSRRFEAREEGVLPEAIFVGPALNRVANTVATDVSDWVLTGGALAE